MKRKPLLFIIYIVLTLGLMWLIFSLSSDNGNESSALSDMVKMWVSNILNHIFPDFFVNFITDKIRKIAHFGAYMCLGITSSLALSEGFRVFATSKSFKPLFYGISLLICILYAISDEIHQLYVPGRCGSPIDVLIDTFGALTGCTIICLITLWIQKKEHT